jgi:hypothetical protein
MDDGLSRVAPVLLGGIFLFLASCGGLTLKGYTGPTLPADDIATVRSGAFANMVRCDGLDLSSTQLKVAVLPGKHTIEMTMRRQLIGFRFFYSDVVGSATFIAQAGRRYLVDVELVPQDKWLGLVASEYDWAGRILDEGTGETMAITTEALPVKVQWIPSARGYETPPN